MIPIQEIQSSSAPIDIRPAKVEEKRYYCTVPTMNVRTSLGRLVQDSMNATRLAHIGEKFAQFHQCHPNYGMYRTTDPEEQDALDVLVALGQDFLSEEEYKRRTTDPRDVIAAQQQQIAELQSQLQAKQMEDRKAELMADIKKKPRE